jgi:hypothetical protein
MPSAYDLQLTIEKLNSPKSPGIDQIPAELVNTGGYRTIRPDMCKLINSTLNKEKLTEEWKQSITVPFYEGVHINP